MRKVYNHCVTNENLHSEAFLSEVIGVFSKHYIIWDRWRLLRLVELEEEKG